jgi:hypothetical protein
VGGGYKADELRIAKPTIGHDYRRGQLHATSAECRHTSIQHALYPVQFVPARPPRALRVWPTDGKIDGHHQLAITDDHDQEDPINAGEHPVFLPTPPGANMAKTSFTSVGNSADSPEPLLRPSPTKGHAAEILDV